MQIGKNDTNEMKFANLATENYGRNLIIQGLTNGVSGAPGQPVLCKSFLYNKFYLKKFNIFRVGPKIRVGRDT